MTVSASIQRRSRTTYQTNPVVYQIMKCIFGTLMRLIYNYKASGKENFPLSGPVIIAVNHLHLFDPAAVMPIVPRKIVTLAADKWEQNWILGTLLRLAGVIFVRRGEVDREALRSCLDVLSSGGVLAIAPEGTRSRTGKLQRAKAGIAYLATRTKAVIIPIAFWGVERLSDWRRLRRPTCNVVVGKPFRLPQPQGKPTTDELQEMADQVMTRIAVMLPPNYRGTYAERAAVLEVEQGLDPASQ